MTKSEGLLWLNWVSLSAYLWVYFICNVSTLVHMATQSSKCMSNMFIFTCQQVAQPFYREHFFMELKVCMLMFISYLG